MSANYNNENNNQNETVNKLLIYKMHLSDILKWT